MTKNLLGKLAPNPPEDITEWIRQYRLMDDLLADIIHCTSGCIDIMFKLGRLELHYDLYRILGHASFLRRIIQNRLEGLRHQLENKEVFEECIKLIPERKRY